MPFCFYKNVRQILTFNQFRVVFGVVDISEVINKQKVLELFPHSMVTIAVVELKSIQIKKEASK